MTHTRVSFGRDVLGPVFAEFALRLWIYVANLTHSQDTALLFCARGGLRLQLLYARFLAASGLDNPVHVGSLMVSRVVAVRPALAVGAASAFEQIGYEFSHSRLLDVATAVSGMASHDFLGAAAWQEPYSRENLETLLNSDAGRPVLDAIRLQADRFRKHLDLCSAGRKRIVLCDTGLFGSTLQLLMDGIPDISWSAVMVARTNYKHLPAPHFPRTVGLSVEADQYCPWVPRTSVLRFWQLIESIFEPNLPSVTRFADNGAPRSNLEVDGWETRVLPEKDSLFAGILEYVDRLPRDPALHVLNDAQAAWRVLHRALAWPGINEGQILDAGLRSDDFGRQMPSFSARPWRGPLAALRGHSMWREGEIVRSARALRTPLLLGIEAAYGVRWFRRNLHRLVR